MRPARIGEGKPGVFRQIFKKISFLFCVTVVGLLSGIAISANDGEIYITGLRVPGSYDVHTYQDKAIDILNISFKINLSFPSKQVLQFYNEKLNKIGWHPYTEYEWRHGDRKWQDFVDGTVAGQPLVHQLLATWRNNDKSRMLVLAIKYHSYLSYKDKMSSKEPNNDIQEVVLQFMPYHELSEVLPPETGR